MCKTGCVNGGCSNPGECFCNVGWSGLLCNVANGSPVATKGLGTCVFSNVTTTCKLADGVPRNDCPPGYSVVGNQACLDIPGYDVNVCGKTCCDGWSGPTCTTGMLLLLALLLSSLALICGAAVCNSCLNGNCTAAYTCTCNAGWTGANCGTGVFANIQPTHIHSL